jgi:methyl-accepting chemotaxis protein
MKIVLSRFSAMGARWSRVSVAGQLATAFTAVLLLTTGLGAFALWALAHENDRASELSSKWLAGVGHLADMRAALVEVREMEVKHSRSEDASYQREYEDKLVVSAKTGAAWLAAYKKIVDGEEDRKLFTAVDTAWASYEKATQQVIQLGRDNKRQDASDISDGAAAMAFDETVGALTKLTAFNFAGGNRAAEAADTAYKQTSIGVLIMLALALTIGGALAVLITRGLTSQLGGEPAAAVAVAQAVAAGDLASAITLRKGDDKSLMFSLHAMQSGLADAVAQVRRGSETVATASVQIAQGNQDLSGRTEQQAAALQQTAATMDELGSTVRNNADNARQANELAQGAARVAEQGGSMVSAVVDTMKGINDSSRTIAEIVSVIDGIAFQTNILALNAAVEAARAGEQGRGFAVVAAEVRSLAQRSASAAKEVKQLINASVERVAQGTAQVDQAGATMQEIVAAIGRVSAIVAEIAAASKEQSTGVSQVCDAVTGMDQATQQNAALVEQSAAAAESLNQQAQQLVQAVAVFRLAQA